MDHSVLSVLVVDDDDAWVLTLKAWLERDGAHVYGCSHGDWALSAVQTHNPDVVLLDVQLPGRNGLEVLQSVRLRWPELPVIVTTAFGGSDVEDAAVRAGADAYIGKPFRMERLLAVIRRITGMPRRDTATEAP
jgi:DNA-binding response OmpR family regulator